MAGHTTLHKPFKTYLWAILFTALGLALCSWVVPHEIRTVEEHIIGFPDTDVQAHQLRPFLLGLLCMLPAIGAWIYSFSGTLDRYTARQFLGAFTLCMGSLLGIFILMDLQANISDFKESADPLKLALSYYGINTPAIFVFLLPYVLLLLLYCLGKMSRHQEIVAMIQTGRGVLRIVAPLLITGVFTSIICFIFNYHWGPWAEGYKDIIIDMAKDGQADKARSVVYRDSNSKRVWFIGAFPYKFEKSGTLRNVTVKEFDENGSPAAKLEATKAVWSRDTRKWTFSGVTSLDLKAYPMPLKINDQDSITRDWKETPWQLVKPGLDQTHLGIPALNSWLAANKGILWANRLPYITQWHYRFAQPVICIITVLLAAPLGIVFSRRGIGGGVSVALFLCAGMLFSSTFFLTFGEAGHLPPALAAWSTNILFTLIALYLFHRRITGRPIYQSILKIFGN